MLSSRHLSLHTTIVGDLSVDSDQVRGDGGLLAPALVVPLKVELFPRPKDERLALQRLSVVLLVPTATQGYVQLGSAVHVFGDSTGHGVWHTYEGHSSDATVELRFPISGAALRLVEDAAHRIQPALNLKLQIRAAFAYVIAVEQLDVRTGIGDQRHLLDQAFDLRSLGSGGSEDLDVQVSREHWAEQVAPRLGLDWFRIVAVRLPKQVEGLDPKLVSIFDEAIRTYERRDYRGAIIACRDIRELVEESLGASGKGGVARIIGAERRLSEDAPEREFIDSAWKLLTDLTNSAHHSQGQGRYSAPDARAALLFTAILLEYLADSLTRRL